MLTEHPIIATAVVFCVVLLASAKDLREKRIPNLITFGAAGIGLLLQVVLAGIGGLKSGLGGLTVGLAFLLPGYLLGFTGAGDVKLMSAVGTYLGPWTAFLAAVASLLAGALLALAYIVYLAASREGTAPWKRYGEMLRYFWATGRPTYLPPDAEEVVNHRFPYALAIAAGTLGVVWWELIRL